VHIGKPGQSPRNVVLECHGYEGTEVFMLGDAGSIASLAGVAVSLLGLGFAILQIMKLRGETRAAREAAEATRLAIGRELASTELTRLGDPIEALKELHRNRDRVRSLAAYPEIRNILLDIRRRHPNLSSADKRAIVRAIAQIGDMETAMEALQEDFTPDIFSDFNGVLTGLQTKLLPLLEDQLQEHA